MRFCSKCGNPIPEGAVTCPECGCAVFQRKNGNGANDSLSLAIKIFLVLGCIAQGWLILPLAWCLPITICIFKRMNRIEPVGLELKICTLLFVNTIAGILLLCRTNDE